MSKSVNESDSNRNQIHTCSLCNYSTKNKYDYNKHMQCAKHLRMMQISNGTLSPINCSCGKVFKERTGLWRHKKSCFVSNNALASFCEKEKDKDKEKDKEKDTSEDPLKEETNLSGAIMTLIKQNQELQKQLFEIAKESKQIIHNSIVTNHNTNHFNLQVFLNETCKEALNMMDFVKLMKIELSDLEEIGRMGYSDGVSRIFVNGLKELDAHKRPIHCSDLKRETLYIKEDNVWEKDNEEKTLIKQAIRCVEHKNIVQIPIWIKAHPNCVVSSNKENTKYLNMICESTGGRDYSQMENNIDKIIRNIAREVVIDKNA
jgi:hypothetical protein